MAVLIPDEVLQTAHFTEAEMLQEIAVMLFQRERLTLAQASRLADMPRIEFQKLLASRQIPMHYDVAQFEAEMATMKRLSTEQFDR
jgi:predicted HTH domain antitoxin